MLLHAHVEDSPQNNTSLPEIKIFYIPLVILLSFSLIYLSDKGDARNRTTRVRVCFYLLFIIISFSIFFYFLPWNGPQHLKNKNEQVWVLCSDMIPSLFFVLHQWYIIIIIIFLIPSTLLPVLVIMRNLHENNCRHN